MSEWWDAAVIVLLALAYFIAIACSAYSIGWHRGYEQAQQARGETRILHAFSFSEPHPFRPEDPPEHRRGSNPDPAGEKPPAPPEPPGPRVVREGWGHVPPPIQRPRNARP